MSEPGGTAAMQRWGESKHSPLAPSETKNANKNCSVCQERETADGYVVDPLVEKGLDHSWQVRLMLVAL